jgi:hypothetical protein
MGAMGCTEPQRCGWLAKARGVQCMYFLNTDAK